VLEINSDGALHPIAVSVAGDWREDDVNALHTLGVAGHDREHPIFRVRARLRTQEGLITSHDDAVHGRACRSMVAATRIASRTN
jgi:hypothetical protein